ncbi:cation:proton antiporter [Erythrobacteraceae bacterium CFH 75059]|uniref:cation:proton antiporter n=1 Tax=Qipengyuania thermophila TaxID=2509361 RepID=UPI00101ED17F|nr:cation:proton antiporter [Qipengyuania thermophila]TCD04824.1 cation:proton antiporter [Erythrobacteraceae bacterium CFH 75059]
MSTVELYLIAMLLIFAAPWAIWKLLRTDRWAPLVVVQIVTGVLLGPGVLGAAFPAVHAAVFQPEVVTALNGLGWWAVLLFVWSAGLELDLRAAWTARAETALTASLALVTPFVFGCLAALVLVASGAAWGGGRGAPWQLVLGIGMGCAVTALPILVLLLERIGQMHRPLGQRILRYASLDDLAIWGVLALILLDWARIGRQALFLLAFVVLAFLVRRVIGRLAPTDRWIAGLVWLAAVALGADWAGLHFMVGGFLAGVVLDVRWFGREALDNFRATVLLTVMPVFFLSTGLRTQWDVGGLAVFGAASLLLAASVTGKLAGLGLAGRLLRWRAGEAGVIGWLLQTKGLIEIIFANVLLDRGIISADLFTAMLLMAVASTMLTVPMVTPLLRRLEPDGASPAGVTGISRGSA